LNSITDGSVEAALTRFAKSGYKHGEVYWRHFGWWNGRVYLLILVGLRSLVQATTRLSG
jgi:hypothetical protein